MVMASIEYLSHFVSYGPNFSACANLISHAAVRDAAYHRIISYSKSNQLIHRSATGNPAR
jgi:hypothetical protein